MTAALLIILIPRHAISDETYISLLRVILAYLNMTPLDSYSRYSTLDLISRLQETGWPYINRVDPEQLQIRKSSIFSNGEAGYYDIPL